MEPYSQKCKICSSCCRKCDGYIFCSNNKCKSNRRFKIVIKHQKPIAGLSKSNPVQVLCPKCQMPGQYFTGGINNKYHKAFCGKCNNYFNCAFEGGLWYKGSDNNYIYYFTLSGSWQ